MLERLIKNWKTTIPAVVAMIVAWFALFGIDISLEQKANIMTIIAGVEALILLFAKD